MTRSEVERFFDRRLDAWTRHDIDALTSDHAEDGSVESPIGGEMRGRAAIEQLYRGLLTSFPDMKIENPELVVENDRVVQIFTLTGTNTGGFMNLPPTGKHFSVPVVLIFTMRDGQIAHEKRVYDFSRLLMEIGVLKAKLV